MGDTYKRNALEVLKWICFVLEDMGEGLTPGSVPIVGSDYPSDLSHKQYFFGRVGGGATVALSGQTDVPDQHEILIVLQASSDKWDAFWEAATLVDRIESTLLRKWDDACQRLSWSIAPLKDEGWWELRQSWEFQYERVFDEQPLA